MAEGLSSQRGPEHSHFLSRFFSGGWERGVIAAFISAFFSFFSFCFCESRKEGRKVRFKDVSFFFFFFECVSKFPRRLYGVPPCSMRYTNKVLFGKHYKLPCMELLLLNIF